MSGGRKRVLISAVLVVVCISFAAWILVVSNERPSLEKSFPDGTSISVGSISYGRTNTYISGNVLQKAVLRLWPRLTWVGGKLHAYTNTTDTAFVFLRFSHPARPWPVRQGYAVTPISISDDWGNEFSYHGAYYRSETTNDLVEGFEISMLPHLAREFRLRATYQDIVLKSNFSAEFQLANPAPPLRADLAARLLPQTNELAEVKLVLERVVPFRANDRGEPDANSADLWTEVTARFLEKDQPTTNWGLSFERLLDGEGNVYRPPIGILGPNFAFLGTPSPRKAWKFVFQVARTNDFNPDEIWTAREVPVPSPEKPFEPIAFTRQDFNVQIDRFTRRGIRLTITPRPVNYEWAFRLNNAKGSREKIRILSTGSGIQIVTATAPERLNYGLALPESITSVDMTFTITKSEYTEFIVQPAPLSPAPAEAK